MAAESDSAARDRLRRAPRPRADARRGGGRARRREEIRQQRVARAREQGRVCCESTTRMGVSEPTSTGRNKGRWRARDIQAAAAALGLVAA